MPRLSVVLLAVALAGGCEWDGPPRDVRVVPSEPDGADSSAESAVEGGGSPSGETAGRPTASSPRIEREVGGVDDRTGAFGAVDMPATVAVVGDSLTVAATDEIIDAVSRVGVRTVLIDGRESRRMTAGGSDLPSGVSAIEGIVASHRPDLWPDLWVVALGTNDVGAEIGAERFRSDVRATLDAIPSDAPVVWVDVWIRDRPDDVAAANALLHAELAGRAAPTSVVDWFSAGAVDGVITGDGVHLTEVGQIRFAAEIAEAVVALALAAS